MNKNQQFNMARELENSATDEEKGKKAEATKATNENLKSGKYFEEKEDSCVYLGVEVPKGEGGDLVPDKSAFQKYFLTKEDYILRREIATSLALNKPLLLEGGTGIGKTSAVAQMCSELNTNYCKVAFGRNTTVEDVIGNKDIDIVDGQEVFKWHDGKLLKAIRDGGIGFLDEYNFQGSKIAGHVNPIVDAILNGYKTVSIPENNHEQVEVHPNFRLLAAQNPPGTEEGQEFPGREVLGSETFGRWTFHKMPLKMTKEMKLNRRKGASGKDIDVNVGDSEFRHLGAGIPESELINVPGMEHWIEKSVEIIEMLEAKSTGAGKEMGKDQRQKLSFNPRLEQAMDKYIANFYRGDINQVWSDALEYFIVQMYKSDIDKEKVREAIKQSYYIPPKQESKRKGLGEREKTEEDERQKTIEEIEKLKGDIPEWLLEKTDKEEVILREAKLEGGIKEQLDKAREIMGDREVMGPVEIKKAFGIEIAESELPPIPFNEIELKKAKELGQFLVLRVNIANDGQPLNMLKMHEILAEDFSKKGAGDVLYDTAGWKEKEAFYTDGTPYVGWALSSKEVILDSTSKNYLEQSFVIADHLEKEVFAGTEMPDEYKEAIKELKDKKEELTKLIETSDRSKYEPEISKLKLNKLTRQSPAEVLYDILVYFQNNDERLLENKYAWTHTATSDGHRVRVGDFGSGGASVDRNSDDRSVSFLGVVFSRNF